MLLRFLLQLVRADFYNPISQSLVKLPTRWSFRCARFFPAMAALIWHRCCWLILQMLMVATGACFRSGACCPSPAVACRRARRSGLSGENLFLRAAGDDYPELGCTRQQQPAIYLLYQITEPVMAPFRKILPPMGGLDFSPILVFILINIIQIALRHMAVRWALQGWSPGYK